MTLRCKFCGAEPSATVTLVNEGRLACRDAGACIERRHRRELERRQGRLFDDEDAARCRRAVDRAVDGYRGRAA